MAANSKRASRASSFRDREYSPTSVWLGRIVVFVLLIGSWEVLSGRAFNAFWLSKPSLIATRIVDMLKDGDLWFHMSATLQEAIAGLAIGMVGGTLLGIGLAFSGIFERWIYPYMMALYSLPRVSLAPLFIVWFGIGLSSKILMVVAMVVFVAFYNAFEGMRNIDKDLMDMMSTYKAKWNHKLRWVVLPSITVWILTSIRLNIGMALIGSVIAELVGSNRGLGYYITYSSNMLDTTGIFTGLVLIMAIAVVLEQCVLLLERTLLRYR
ncbi:ABC transporter permease [Cohnella sp. JJ-181]|uniref:ABC transporter permease n=1 Tax=Cohnella rhizoplanae TaxID=2974897 RepID=UPI0022FF727A|nr:ABC transporter permease [Cohnella sp. JJ-181]CAI6079832.1 Putative aliphatic sulfonates transport permease protein SsuC [Cohnella sp. JJ-181]